MELEEQRHSGSEHLLDYLKVVSALPSTIGHDGPLMRSTAVGFSASTSLFVPLKILDLIPGR